VTGKICVRTSSPVLDRLSADLLAIQKLQQRLRRMLRFCDEGRCPFIRSSPPAEMAVEE
jgi:hypothetical protein